MAHLKCRKSSTGMKSIIWCKYFVAITSTRIPEIFRIIQIRIDILVIRIRIPTLRYYIGTPESQPSRRHLYRVSSLPPRFGDVLKRPQCLSCSRVEPDKLKTSTNAPPRLVTNWDDDWEDEPTLPPVVTQAPRRKHGAKPEVVVKPAPLPCQYYDASFAPGKHSLAIIECLGPEVPTSAIYRIPIEFNPKKALEPIFHVQNNTQLKQRAALVAFPQVKTFPVMISGGYYAQVRLFLPPGLREDEITRYPMVLHV